MERYNASEYFLDRRLEAGDGDRVAVISQGHEHTYAELAGRTAQVANALRALGVSREERVLIVALDGVPWVTSFLGAMRMGAVPVPVSTMLTGAELAFMFNDARARVAIASAELGRAISDMADGSDELAHLILTGDGDVVVGDSVNVHRFDEWATGADTFEADATVADSPGFWLYTSGTTGKPKGAMHRHVDLPFTAETYGQQVLGITPDDRCYSVAKLFFAYGLGNLLSFPFAVGATTILDPAKPTPDGVAAVVRANRPTLFFGVPTFYAALLASKIADDTFVSVRYGVSAGEPLPAEIFRRFKERFGVEILDGIGTTELTHIFISNYPGDITPGKSGRIVPGYDAKLVADDGLPAGDDEPGHLLVKGESVATGYWCRTDVTRRQFQGEWLRTGDVYSRSADGIFSYEGRSDDMIKAGGIWVSPAEVEATLVGHAEVMEAAVVGEPDSDGNVKPVAYVVALPDAEPDPDELVAYCKEQLASFKRPRKVYLVEDLPKTATGKIQRYKLRDG